MLYGAAGFLEGGVVLARSLHLEKMLPADRRATGFSLQYAAIGWGFAAGSILLAQFITFMAPQGILAIAGGTVAVIALIALLTPTSRTEIPFPGPAIQATEHKGGR